MGEPIQRSTYLKSEENIRNIRIIFLQILGVRNALKFYLILIQKLIYYEQKFSHISAIRVSTVIKKTIIFKETGSTELQYLLPRPHEKSNM